jgi:hypothetical protein
LLWKFAIPPEEQDFIGTTEKVLKHDLKIIYFLQPQNPTIFNKNKVIYNATRLGSSDISI